MSSRPKSALREVLEAHLVKTGRSIGETVKDETAEARKIREATRNAKAEAFSGEVLAKIENATVEQQKKWNERLDTLIAPLEIELTQAKLAFDSLPDTPVNADARKEKTELQKTLKEKIDALRSKKVRLTHAVSGHGKGTDQMGRVLHGHRADEPVTGTPTTVGSDPSNTSGAFTSNQGMAPLAGPEVIPDAGWHGAGQCRRGTHRRCEPSIRRMRARPGAA